MELGIFNDSVSFTEMAGAKPKTPTGHDMTSYVSRFHLHLRLTISASYSWLIYSARASIDRFLHHGVPRLDLSIQSRIRGCTSWSTRPISNPSSPSPRLASTDSDVSRTYALCHDNVSTVHTSCRCTSSATTHIVDPSTTYLDTYHIQPTLSAFTTVVHTPPKTTPRSHLNDTIPLRDHRCLRLHPVELLLYNMATLVAQLKSLRWNNGSQMSISMTPTR